MQELSYLLSGSNIDAQAYASGSEAFCNTSLLSTHSDIVMGDELLGSGSRLGMALNPSSSSNNEIPTEGLSADRSNQTEGICYQSVSREVAQARPDLLQSVRTSDVVRSAAIGSGEKQSSELLPADVYDMSNETATVSTISTSHSSGGTDRTSQLSPEGPLRTLALANTPTSLTPSTVTKICDSTMISDTPNLEERGWNDCGPSLQFDNTHRTATNNLSRKHPDVAIHYPSPQEPHNGDSFHFPPMEIYHNSELLPNNSLSQIASPRPIIPQLPESAEGDAALPYKPEHSFSYTKNKRRIQHMFKDTTMTEGEKVSPAIHRPKSLSIDTPEPETSGFSTKLVFESPTSIYDAVAEFRQAYENHKSLLEAEEEEAGTLFSCADHSINRELPFERVPVSTRNGQEFEPSERNETTKTSHQPLENHGDNRSRTGQVSFGSVYIREHQVCFAQEFAHSIEMPIGLDWKSGRERQFSVEDFEHVKSMFPLSAESWAEGTAHRTCREERYHKLKRLCGYSDFELESMKSLGNHLPPDQEPVVSPRLILCDKLVDKEDSGSTSASSSSTDDCGEKDNTTCITESTAASSESTRTTIFEEFAEEQDFDEGDRKLVTTPNRGWAWGVRSCWRSFDRRSSCGANLDPTFD